MNTVAGKQFVMHFDYVIADLRTVRVSVSNLYKEFKVRLTFLTCLELKWNILVDSAKLRRIEMDCCVFKCFSNI
jgi:5'(3')-deoxyribonucleotidase